MRTNVILATPDPLGTAIRALLAGRYGEGAMDAPDALPLRRLLRPGDDVREVSLLLEAAFGVALPDHATERLHTVGDLVHSVRTCLWTAGARHRMPRAA